MFCPDCRAVLPDDARYCINCGYDLLKIKPSSRSFKSPPDPLEALRTIPSFTESTIIGNRYEVLFKLGEGGMGKVYAARDQELKELRAVKVLPQQIADDIKAINQLKIEKSENIL